MEGSDISVSQQRICLHRILMPILHLLFMLFTKILRSRWGYCPTPLSRYHRLYLVLSSFGRVSSFGNISAKSLSAGNMPSLDTKAHFTSVIHDTKILKSCRGYCPIPILRSFSVLSRFGKNEFCPKIFRLAQ